LEKKNYDEERPVQPPELCSTSPLDAVRAHITEGCSAVSSPFAIRPLAAVIVWVVMQRTAAGDVTLANGTVELGN